jgi:wyosine [tRNA(Phe)-imidazoG37] synthetase (radical SAM superfamily)
VTPASHGPARSEGEWALDGNPGLPIAFGPVRSRRLGWSLGINNVPPKTCSYSCVYCQVGATDLARVERTSHIVPAEVVAAVESCLARCASRGQPVDCATFVPDGEPTLDLDLGEAIRGVAALGIRVAVLTNGSLLWRDDVRADLAAAQTVSIKVDTVDEGIWHRLNRPIGRLRLEAVLDGMRRFAHEHPGDLVTETLLVEGVNDAPAAIAQTASFVAELGPRRAYVAIPTRPPAEPWVRAPTVDVARRAADVFRAAGVPTTGLFEELERPFAATGDPATGLLGIVAVHPMSEDDARDYLARSGADWSVVEALLQQGRIVTVRHDGRTYLRTRR